MNRGGTDVSGAGMQEGMHGSASVQDFVFFFFHRNRLSLLLFQTINASQPIPGVRDN